MTAEFETSEEAEAVDAATRAFEDLRTEIAGLRQVVEALGPAIATGRAPDYSPTLGAIAKTLQAATLRIDAIAKHTGANLATEIARREIARVYDESLRPARLDLERSTREVLDAVNVVNGAVAKVRTGRGQRAWILRSSAIGLVVGLVAFPLLLTSGRPVAAGALEHPGADGDECARSSGLGCGRFADAGRQPERMEAAYGSRRRGASWWGGTEGLPGCGYEGGQGSAVHDRSEARR